MDFDIVKKSMLKCHDALTDGPVSRWSFHTA